nr:MFS transporter [Candidatus Freyarchaeota archaeon]
MPKKKDSTKAETEEKIPGRKRSIASVGTAYFVNNADMQALPTYFNSIGREFAKGRTSLGFVNTVSSVVQTAALPFWGFLSDKFSRKKTLIAGILIWATATFLISFAGSFDQLLYFRILVGLGLATITPTGFSIIVDMYKPEIRGRMFGIFQLMGLLGIVVTVPILGMLDAPSLTFGIESNLTQLLYLQFADLYFNLSPGFMGLLRNALFLDYFLKQTIYLGAWRQGFRILAIISFVIAGIIAVFLKEPVRGASEKELKDVITKENVEKYKIDRKAAGNVLRIPTMWVIIAQGLTGFFPWIVYQVWLIYWLESVRYLTPEQATLVFAMIVLGSAVGNVIGGFLGDKAEARSPKKGRIIVAQISVFIGIPMSWIILFVVQNFMVFMIFALVTAALISWAGPGAVTPIVAAVNKPEVRSTAYSLEQIFEQGFGAFAAVLVGFFADSVINGGIAGFAMGWISPYIGLWLIVGTPVVWLLFWMSLAGQALTYSMMIFVTIPWALCFLFWFLAYRYYPKDRQKIADLLMQRRKEIAKK